MRNDSVDERLVGLVLRADGQHPAGARNYEQQVGRHADKRVHVRRASADEDQSIERRSAHALTLLASAAAAKSVADADPSIGLRLAAAAASVPVVRIQTADRMATCGYARAESFSPGSGPADGLAMPVAQCAPKPGRMS